MKRFPPFAAVLAAATLLLAACGDDDTGDSAEEPTSESTGDATESGTGLLAEGVAAVVDGEEIGTATVEEHVEAFAAIPQFAEQMAGPDGEAARVQLRAQILSTEIVALILANGAEELGDPITDEDMATARTDLEEQVGGPDALTAALDQQGLTESLLDLELTALAAIDNIEGALAEESGGEAAAGDEEPAVEGAPSPSEQRTQEFLQEELSAADVTVDEEYGTWSAETGQVTAPGAAPAPSAGG